MLHVGMDMHKKFSVVTVVDEEGKEIVAGRRIENDPAEVSQFMSSLDGEEARVVLEAGSNWQWMCDILDEIGVDNRLCHPLKTKAIASARIKSDRIDSGILAKLSRMDFVPEAYKADIETRHLREMLRCRAGLVSERTSFKNRIHAILTKFNVSNPYTDLFGKAGTGLLKELELPPVYRKSLDGYLRMVEALSIEVKKADREIEKTFKGSPEAQLLSTIPGVGRLLALTILAEIVDIERFSSAKQLASFAGLVPSTSQSGETTRHGHITRQGSKWLRWAMVEASIHAVRKPGPLRKHFERLRRKKGYKVAIVASARKLCTYIYHMLNERKDYGAIVRYLGSDLG